MRRSGSWLLLTALIVGALACGELCDLCDSSTNTCYACKSADYRPLEDGNCAVKPTVLDGCLVYALNGGCKRCSLAYWLEAATGKCLKDHVGCLSTSATDNSCTNCGFGTKLENGRCTGILNCDTYDSSNPKICKNCAPGFDSFDIACLVNEGCITTMDNGGCSECNSGLALSGFSCFAPNKLVPGCAVVDAKGGCKYCEEGLIPQDKKCVVPGQLITVQAQPTETKSLKLDSSPAPQVAVQPLLTNVRSDQTLNPSVVMVAPPASPPQVQPQQNPTQPAGNDDQCRTYDETTKTCLGCNYGCYLSSGKCVQVSKLCDGYNLVTGECLGCIAGYKLNGNGGCSEDIAQDPNCNVFQGGKCITCKYGFILKNDICNPVNPLCQGYDLLNGKCLGCPPNYTLKDGDCLETKNILQPINTQVPPQQGQPAQGSHQPIPPQTQPPQQPSQPQSQPSQQPPQQPPIQPAQAVQQPQLVQPLLQVQPTQIQVQVQTPQIPYAPFDASIHTPPQSSNPQQNYFAQPDASTAISRDPRCKAFARDNTCIECSKGYLLTVTKKCKLINQLCAESDPKDGSCTKCYNGYRLEHGKCIVKLADPNCKEFVDNICKTCSNGYYLNKENRCTMFNPQCATAEQTTGNCLTCYKGYLLKDGKCVMGSQDANCRLFENGQCKACNTGYFNSNGKCTQASTLCATFDPNNGNCLTCYNGYMLSGATCVVGTADPNCREYQNRQCSKCSNGFFVKQGKCTQVSTLCAKFDQNTGDCTACYPGYGLNSGKCEVGSSDPHCRSFKDGVCQSCSRGYFLSSNRCIVQNSLCRTINQDDGSCMSCYPGYTLTPKGECIVPANNDPNCAQKSGSTCLSCNDRYFLEKGICCPVNPLCYTYDMLSGRCVNCYTGYFVSKGQCLPSLQSNDSNCETVDQGGKCIKCRQGHYLNPSDGKCTAVSLLCQNFDYNQNKCTACQQGYFLQDNECIFPSMGVDPHCTHYTNSYCDKCENGFAINNYQCAPAV